MKTRRLKIIQKDTWIVDRVRGGSVLHVGCTDWPLTAARVADGRLLHAKLCEVCPECVGVDLDGDGIRALRELMPERVFHELNAESLADSDELAESRWDFIVAGDVVEHMDNPGLFFESARKLLKPGGTLIVTVPSVFSAKRFFWLLLTGNEQVHPDHTAYFSEANFIQIASRNGLRISSLAGFQWENPTLKNRVSNLLASPLVWLSGGRCADELAVEFETG